MAAVARFTFDLDLAHDQPQADPVGDIERAEQLQQARAQGYAEGFAAGEKSAASAATRALADAAAALAERAASLLAGLERSQHGLEDRAIGLATAVARKLTTALLTAQPVAELDALLADCLSSLGSVPHLVIHCHPDLTDAVRDAAETRAAQSGFAGRLIVMGEPDIAPGDGRIEWADGGLVRDHAAIEAAIDERIAAYATARDNSISEEISP